MNKAIKKYSAVTGTFTIHHGTPEGYTFEPYEKPPFKISGLIADVIIISFIAVWVSILFNWPNVQQWAMIVCFFSVIAMMINIMWGMIKEQKYN